LSDALSFADFLKRVRAGDAGAAEELVRRYEPAIRVAVRAHLVDLNLRRHFDSMDVCQSVLCSFFVRAAAGQYDLTEPTHLINLLVKMTRNKLAQQARRHHQQKRDARRAVGGDALEAIVGNEAGPTQTIAGKDLLDAVLDRLSAEEREIAQRRAIGQEWVDIANEMGGTSEGRRKQLARALDRVGPGLGLDEEDDD
jgi:RNA polymerase sigma-70 factor (ECF subfamily)